MQGGRRNLPQHAADNITASATSNDNPDSPFSAKPRRSTGVVQQQVQDSSARLNSMRRRQSSEAAAAAGPVVISGGSRSTSLGQPGGVGSARSSLLDGPVLSLSRQPHAGLDASASAPSSRFTSLRQRLREVKLARQQQQKTSSRHGGGGSSVVSDSTDSSSVVSEGSSVVEAKLERLLLQVGQPDAGSSGSSRLATSSKSSAVEQTTPRPLLLGRLAGVSRQHAPAAAAAAAAAPKGGLGVTVRRFKPPTLQVAAAVQPLAAAVPPAPHPEQQLARQQQSQPSGPAAAAAAAAADTQLAPAEASTTLHSNGSRRPVSLQLLGVLAPDASGSGTPPAAAAEAAVAASCQQLQQQQQRRHSSMQQEHASSAAVSHQATPSCTAAAAAAASGAAQAADSCAAAAAADVYDEDTDIQLLMRKVAACVSHASNADAAGGPGGSSLSAAVPAAAVGLKGSEPQPASALNRARSTSSSTSSNSSCSHALPERALLLAHAANASAAVQPFVPPPPAASLEASSSSPVPQEHHQQQHSPPSGRRPALQRHVSWKADVEVASLGQSATDAADGQLSPPQAGAETVHESKARRSSEVHSHRTLGMLLPGDSGREPAAEPDHSLRMACSWTGREQVGSVPSPSVVPRRSTPPAAHVGHQQTPPPPAPVVVSLSSAVLALAADLEQQQQRLQHQAEGMREAAHPASSNPASHHGCSAASGRGRELSAPAAAVSGPEGCACTVNRPLQGSGLHAEHAVSGGPAALGLTAADNDTVSSCCGSSELSAMANPMTYADRLTQRMMQHLGPQRAGGADGGGGWTGVSAAAAAGTNGGGGVVVAAADMNGAGGGAVHLLDRYLEGHKGLKQKAARLGVSLEEKKQQMKQMKQQQQPGVATAVFGANGQQRVTSHTHPTGGPLFSLHPQPPAPSIKRPLSSRLSGAAGASGSGGAGVAAQQPASGGVGSISSAHHRLNVEELRQDVELILLRRV